MNIGRSITIALAKADRSPKWLASQIGANTTQGVYNLMKQQSCQLSTAARLAAVFGLSMDEFIALGEEKIETDGGDSA